MGQYQAAACYDGVIVSHPKAKSIKVFLRDGQWKAEVLADIYDLTPGPKREENDASFRGQ